MEIKPVDHGNFRPDPLREFRRHQKAGNVYRLRDRELTLMYQPIPAYVEAEPCDLQMECPL